MGWARMGSLVGGIVAFALPLRATAISGQGALRAAAAAAGLHVGAAARAPGEDPALEVVLVGEFDSLTPENHLKWAALSAGPGVYDFTVADALVAQAEENEMRVRGHTLVWGRGNGVPAWLEGEVLPAPDPTARLRALLEQHIATVVGRYAGRIESWDVVNEPLRLGSDSLDPESLFFRFLGPGYVAEAFELAHAADPAARLFLNEVLVEVLPAKAEGLRRLVGDLLAQDVPIHGVGLQGHFFFGVPERSELEALIRSFTDLGLEVELTEIDVPLFLFDEEADPLTRQAAAYSEIFAACRAVQGCRGLTTWGVSDRSTWLDRTAPWADRAPNQPLLFDAALEPKPAYFAAVTALPEPRLEALGWSALATVGLLRLRLGGCAIPRRRIRRSAPPTTRLQG